MSLGKIDRRHITRIFFPWFCEKGENPAIRTEMRTYIYEKCLRPAILHVDPFNQSRWPITYGEAMKLYRDEKGQFHFGSIDLPPRFLHEFSTKLLELLQKHERLKDAFFLHEMRGMKGGTHYDNAADPAARKKAVEFVFRDLDFSRLTEDDWFLDVGTEFSCQGFVLQWLTVGHRYVLQTALPSASPEQISAILQSSQQFKLDIAAQLGDLGGFRSEPGSRGAKDKVSHLITYQTDKAATYQLHNGIFKRRKAWNVLPGWDKKYWKKMEWIAQTFETCAGDTERSPLESNARLEVRVPLSKAYGALLDFPESVARQSIAAINPQVFWQVFLYSRS